MSSEVFYSPRIEAERCAKLVAFWDKELEMILEKKREHKKILEKKNNNDEIIKTFFQGAYCYNTKQCSEQKENTGVNVNQVLTYENVKKVLDNLKKELRYGIDDLKRIRVVRRVDVVNKRNLLYELNSINNKMDEYEKSAVIERFIKENEIASGEKIELIEQYEEYLERMGQNVEEGCSYEEAKENIEKIKQEFYEKKKKEYISESIKTVMKKNGIIHMDMTNFVNADQSERYYVENINESSIEITDLGINRYVMDYIGINRTGQSLSEDQLRNHVMKSKQICSLWRVITEELRLEYGIEMSLYDVKEPDVRTVQIEDSYYIDERESHTVENKITMKAN